MIGQRQAQASFQSDFYRNVYRKMLNALMVFVVALLLLIVAIVYYVFFQPSPSYYVTTTTGKIIPMVAGP